jgi:hypothetical protein
MSSFARLKGQFVVNWTTVLVGWKGLGVFSPWPARSADFPPLLSADELAAYANDRLALSSDAAEDDLVVRLLSLDLHTEGRETITEHLARLSDLSGCDPSHELRKWQVVLLEDLLDHIPSDPLYGLIALTEFWQNFGFPADSPHEVQGKGNTISPDDYYQESNYRRLVSRHKAWIEQEKAGLLVQKKLRGQNYLPYKRPLK